MNTLRAISAHHEPEKPRRPRHTHRGLRVAGAVAASMLLLLVVCAAGLVALVNVDGVHRYLIGLAERKASEKLGARVSLDNFTLHLSTLSLDLYGIGVDGAKPYASPRLLVVDHVAVGVRVVSVLGRKWYFDNVRVDHPVAWVFIDKNGNSNLPTFQNNGGNSNTGIFDLGVRHAVLDRGEIYFNSRPSALAADVHDLNFQASYNAFRSMYSGDLAYTNGNVQYGAIRPFVHSLALEFDATPKAFHLAQAKLSSGPSQVVLSGTLDDYSNPAVRAHYDAIVDGNQVGALLESPSIPAGLVHTAGDLQYQQEAGSSLIDTLTVAGSAESRQLAVKAGTARAEVENLTFLYSLAHGDAALRNLRAQIFGGQVFAEGVMKNIDGDEHSTLNASLHGVSLAQLRQTFVRPTVQPGVALTGTLNATASAAWGKTLSDLTAHADATMQGEAAKAGQGEIAKAGGAGAQPASLRSIPDSSATFPVESSIHANYSGAEQRLELNNSYLRTPQTNLTLNGTVSRDSSLVVQFEANDLREVAAIADLFRTPAPGKPVEPLDVGGKASFQGTVRGSTSAPHLNGQLTAQDLQVNGTAWKALRAGIELSPDRAILRNVELDPAARGRITLNASAGLDHWSFSNRSPVEVQLAASELNIADLEKIAGPQLPVTGTLNANLALHGSELEPEGTGSVTVTNATAYAQPIQSAKVSFSGSGERARVELRVDLPAGSVQGDATLQPRQRTFTARLSSTGIHLERLQAMQARNVAATGTLAFQVRGQGAFDNPQLDANLEISALKIADQALSGLKLEMNMANRVANATLATSAIGAEIQAKARVEIGNDYETDASLDTRAFPLGPLLAAYAPDESDQVSGETEIHATLHGPLKNKNLLEAHVSIPVLKLGYSNAIQLAAGAPIQIDYKNGVVNLQPASIKGTDTDLQVQAAVPLSGNAPMSLLAKGTVNLQLIQLFDPDLRTSGELKLNIDSHGPLRAGNVGGEIDIANANLSSADLPVGLENANGVLRLTSDRINVEKFEATMGGGTVTAQGGVSYRPSLQFNLGLTARGARVLYPQGMRENVDADLRLAGSPANAMLGGQVNLADISFTQAFDMNSFVSQLSGGTSAPAGQGFAQNLELNVAVHSTNSVNLVSRSLSVGGSANLQLRGTAAQPVVLGRVNLSGGDIILNGNRFVLNGGTVQFVNPSETEPVVNVALSTTIQEYKIDLRFDGPVEQMRTEYSSNPSLPQADIINLLAFGETTEAAANNQTPANQAAESLVASQVSSQVTSRISKVAGISQLSISPVLAGSSQQGPAGANITIRQRVTGNLFVTFSTNVATTQDQTIQGQYQVSPRVAISATRDPNGGFAVDTLIKKSW
jgi:translocation and assembly module TamB